MMNKRGAMSIEMVVAILLALVVLVILILGFMLGWDKFLPWLSSNNVDGVKQACGAACTTSSTFDFCDAKRALNSGTEKLKDINCNYLAEKKVVYAIEKCPAITCTSLLSDAVTKDLAEKDAQCTAANAGKTIYYLEASTLKSTTCPAATPAP